jgi:hypothetical protein
VSIFIVGGIVSSWCNAIYFSLQSMSRNVEIIRFSGI